MHEFGDFWPFFTAFAALVAAGCGFPIPEELPTIGAGIWVGSNPDFGPLRWLILPVCFLGVLISDVMLYQIGHWSGSGLLERAWVKRLLPPNKWARIQQNYDRYGVKVLLLIRWVPAIRSPMFISAGIMRLPLVRFIVADSIAAVFGHSLLFFLAFWFGDQFRDLVTRAEQRVDQLKPLLTLLLLAGLAGFLLYHFLRSPVSTADPEELPLIGDRVASKIEHLVVGQDSNPASSGPAGSESCPTTTAATLTDAGKNLSSDSISNGPPRSEATERDAIP